MTFKPTVIGRVSLGLASLVLLLMLLLDFVFGLSTGEEQRERQWRQQFSEALAMKASVALSQQRDAAAGRLLDDAVAHNRGLLSVALRRADGRLLHASDRHAVLWQPEAAGRRQPAHQSQVPLGSGAKAWGTLELVFKPSGWFQVLGVSVGAQLLWPPALFAVLLGLFRLYLGRVLRQLDPSKAVPDRIRSAYDALAEGVVILDAQGLVVLANGAYRGLQAEGATHDPLGKPVATDGWGVAHQTDALPWRRALVTREAVSSERLDIQLQGQVRTLMVSCMPLLDHRRQLKGCLVSFFDRTEVERSNHQLKEALGQLQESSEKIKAQNVELHRLATRDPLTGALNRRAFFDMAHQLIERTARDGRPLTCIMTDIDHFKQFNDKHGHAIGDEVLKAVTAALSTGLREQDMLCRYGGEEFCIFLPDCDVPGAQRVAERLRAQVEAQAGPAVKSAVPLKVTSSFGISLFNAELREAGALIDLADQALYNAKRAGRNRVVVYQPTTESPAIAQQKQPEAAHA